MRLFAALCIVLLALPTAMAFGVTPGRQTYDYQDTINGAFTVVNNDAQELELTIVARGDLSEHVTFGMQLIEFSAGDEQQRIRYSIDLPEDLEPGEHRIDLYVLALSSQGLGSNIVGSATGVVSQVVVKVPYPGRFVRARLDYDAVENTVHVPVFGLGRERIDDLAVDLTLYGPTNEVVAAERSDIRTLSPGGIEEFAFPLDVEPGTYFVRASVSYGNDVRLVEDTVSIGRASIVIQDIDVPEYQFGSISKLVLETKSEWNEPIDTTATVEFYDSSGSLRERVRSALITVEPFERADIPIYWDSAGYDPGEYRISAKLSVGDQAVERTFPITMTPSAIEIGATGNVTAGEGGLSGIIIAVVVLVILNIGLLFVLFKRKKD